MKYNERQTPNLSERDTVSELPNQIRPESKEDLANLNERPRKHFFPICVFIILLVIAIYLVVHTYTEPISHQKADTSEIQSSQKQSAPSSTNSSFQSTHDFNKESPNILSSNPKSQGQTVPSTPFAKIFWLLTEFDYRAQNTLESVVFNSLKYHAQLSGYDVRVVDKWNAYQYLSPNITERITLAMHTKRVKISVIHFLRLALLIEHGGVSLQVGDSILIEKLDWLEEIFQGKSVDLKRKYICQGLEYPEVMMFQSFSDNIYGMFFYREFIAARKGSILLREVFDEMVQMIKTGVWNYEEYDRITQFNSVTGATNFYGMVEKAFQAKLYHARTAKNLTKTEVCINYKIQSLNIKSDYNLAHPLCKRGQIEHITEDLAQVEKRCGKERFWIKIGYQSVDIFAKILNFQKDQYHSNSYLAQFIFKGVNEEYLIPPEAYRKVHLCVVSLGLVPKNEEEKIKSSWKELQKQTYKDWTAVYMSEDEYKMVSLSQTQRVIIGKSSGNKGLDAQTAFAKLCPNNSIVFLLDYRERLKEETAFQTINEKLRDRQVFGAFVSVQKDGETRLAQNYPKFCRRDYYLLSPVQPKALNDILNNFRVFDSNIYKVLPKFDLHRVGTGEYYEDRLIYLMAILEAAAQYPAYRDFPAYMIYTLRRAYKIFYLPSRSEALESVVILVNEFQEYSKEQLQEIKFKFFYQGLKPMVKDYVENGFPVEELFVLNDGEPPSTYKERQYMPKIIPKIIHQVWVKGNLPPIKAYLSKQARLMYPDYEYKLWKEENLTAQNFPMTHLILKNIVYLEPFGKYNRMAIISDYVRAEALYHQGGFYFDLNFQWFRKSFDDWRTYKYVTGAFIGLRHRGMLQICFIAAAPGFPGLLRVVNYTNTNRYDFFTTTNIKETGPNNFHKVIRGNEEMNKDILIIPFQILYPASWTYKIMPDQCLVGDRDSGIVATEKGRGLVADCADRYPSYILGMEHSDIGNSWIIPNN